MILLDLEYRSLEEVLLIVTDNLSDTNNSAYPNTQVRKYCILRFVLANNKKSAINLPNKFKKRSY